MNFSIAPLVSELGTPLAVFLLGFVIYWRERKNPGKDDQEIPAEFKLWMAEHIRDPILEAIRGRK